ncbi:MAG: DUF2953 domain-containing protein [Nitrospinota bacterium]|nr:DUF2953 domain-containing protein [Nitrospinota bacterium]
MLLSGALALLLIVALLAIPVEIAFNIQRRETFHIAVSIGWLFGVIRTPLPNNGSKPSSGQRKEKKGRKGGRGRKALSVARNSRFRRRVIRLLRDILGAIRMPGFTLRARLGLGDPADTGMLWGFVGPLVAVLTDVRSAVICIEPEFMYELFEFDCRGKVRVIPIQFVYIAILFILSPITIRMLWELR